MMMDLCMKFESYQTKNISLYRVFKEKCYEITHSLILARTHPTTHERPH